MSYKKRKDRTTKQIRDNNKKKRNILYVFRSNKNIVAQIIDLDGNVLVTASSSSKEFKKSSSGKKGLEIAKMIGQEIAKKAIEKGIKEIVFNKGPYLYIGRVKSLADGAREGGLIF